MLTVSIKLKKPERNLKLKRKSETKLYLKIRNSMFDEIKRKRRRKYIEGTNQLFSLNIELDLEIYEDGYNGF